MENIICENCKIPHDGKYGSGRFCGLKCARGFSTKNKRLEINAKVSKTLSLNRITIKCQICSKDFLAKVCRDGKIYRKLCSKVCSKIYCRKNVLGKRWTVSDSSKMGGLRDGGGRTKTTPYINNFSEEMHLNKEEVRVAIELDKSGFLWKRNFVGFKYTNLDGKNRKFYPDFYIPELNLFIEYKGWVTDEMTHKMNDAKDKNLDLNLLIIYSENKRYANLGLNISQFLTNSKDILLSQSKM